MIIGKIIAIKKGDSWNRYKKEILGVMIEFDPEKVKNLTGGFKTGLFVLKEDVFREPKKERKVFLRSGFPLRFTKGVKIRKISKENPQKEGEPE